MASKPSASYLQERNGWFHYRRRVPHDVSLVIAVETWKKSLKTKSQREAEVACRALAVEHDRIITRVRQLSDLECYNALLRRRDHFYETPHDQKVADQANQAGDAAFDTFEKLIKNAEKRLYLLPVDVRDAIQNAGGLENYYQNFQSARASYHTDQISIPLQTEFGNLSSEQGEILEAPLKVRAKHLAQREQHLEKLGLLNCIETQENDPDNPRIKTATAQWFEDRKQNAITQNRHTTAINRFVEKFGNVPVQGVTKEMCRTYIKTIEALPDSRSMPSKLRGRLHDPDPSLAHIAPSTVGRHLSSIKALFGYCIARSWLISNPATGIRIASGQRPKSQRRRSFTIEERTILLQRASLEYGPTSDVAWFIRLTAYTGARLEELAQLAKDNVIQCEGIWCIEINDKDGRHVKNESSIRHVPIHSDICTEFLAWLKDQPGPLIFDFVKRDSIGRFANNASGFFARLMDRAGLTDKTLVFHSFRHTLKTEMNRSGIDSDVRRLILGHGAKDPHDRYGEYPISSLAKEFEKLSPMFNAFISNDN